MSYFSPKLHIIPILFPPPDGGKINKKYTPKKIFPGL